MSTATSPNFRASSLQETDAQPIEHVSVANYGWYLFNCIPLVCGNADENADFPLKFFEDQVTADVVHGRLTKYAASRHADVADINLIFQDNVLLTISSSSVPIPIPYVFTYRERTISAVLVRPTSPEVFADVRKRQLKREMDALFKNLPEKGSAR